MISPTADRLEFRKFSVTQQFRCRPAARPQRPGSAGGGAPRRSSPGDSEGRAARSRPARVQAPGPGRRPSPGDDFIFSGQRPPRARFDPVRGAGGPTGSRRRSPRRAEGKGWRLERGAGIAPRRPRVSGDRPLAHPPPHPRKGGRAECGAGLATPSTGCGLWPVGWSSRARPAARPAGSRSRPAPRRAVRAPGRRLAAARGPPAEGPVAAAGPGAARVARRPFRVPSPRAASPGPEKGPYLPPPPPPSRRRYPWRRGPCPARRRAAASRPSGRSGGWASAGAEPCEFGGGGGRGGAAGWLALPPPAALSIPRPSAAAAAAAPPPVAHLPLASEAPGCRRVRRRRNFLL